MEVITLTDQSPSPKTAALIAGFTILFLALTVPVAEFYIFPKLVDYKNATQTAENITRNTSLFTVGIFIHFLSVLCDIIVAWALYVFLKPVHRNMALLAAWLRIVYAAFNVGALLNLVHVLVLVRMQQSLAATSPQIDQLMLSYVRAFDMEWKFGLTFFGVCMGSLGWLVLKATYIPKTMGIALFVACVGYVIEGLRYFFLPHVNADFLFITFLGELVFMAWLLIKGWKVTADEFLIPSSK